MITLKRFHCIIINKLELTSIPVELLTLMGMKDGRRSESPSIFHRKQKSFFLTHNLKRKY